MDSDDEWLQEFLSPKRDLCQCYPSGSWMLEIPTQTPGHWPALQKVSVDCSRLFRYAYMVALDDPAF